MSSLQRTSHCNVEVRSVSSVSFRCDNYCIAYDVRLRPWKCSYTSPRVRDQSDVNVLANAPRTTVRLTSYSGSRTPPPASSLVPRSSIGFLFHDAQVGCSTTRHLRAVHDGEQVLARLDLEQQAPCWLPVNAVHILRHYGQEIMSTFCPNWKLEVTKILSDSLPF